MNIIQIATVNGRIGIVQNCMKSRTVRTSLAFYIARGLWCNPFTERDARECNRFAAARRPRTRPRHPSHALRVRRPRRRVPYPPRVRIHTQTRTEQSAICNVTNSTLKKSQCPSATLILYDQWDASGVCAKNSRSNASFCLVSFPGSQGSCSPSVLLRQ